MKKNLIAVFALAAYFVVASVWLGSVFPNWTA